MQLAITDIHVRARHRRELGDLSDLKASMTTLGLLHPIVVTDGHRLIAGARRLRAARELGWPSVPVRIIKTLDDAVSLLRAERDENTCRKDFLPSEAVALARDLEPLEQRAAKDRQRAGGRAGGLHEGSANLAEPSEARDKIAAAVGVPRSTLAKARAIVDAAEAEPARFDQFRAQMDETGNVDRAFKALEREERHAAMRARTPGAPPSGRYRVIYADPPWQYNDAGVITESDAYGRAARHYPSLSIAELAALPIRDCADDPAVLFLWVTSPLLAECWPVIDAWGFTYKTSIVWDKVRHNFGHYVSVRHELLLIATRGSCLPDHPTPMPDSVISIPRSDEHSAKPADFRELIMRLYDGPYLELFGRAAVDGWTVYGNDVKPREVAS